MWLVRKTKAGFNDTRCTSRMLPGTFLYPRGFAALEGKSIMGDAHDTSRHCYCQAMVSKTRRAPDFFARFIFMGPRQKKQSSFQYELACHCHSQRSYTFIGLDICHRHLQVAQGWCPHPVPTYHAVISMWLICYMLHLCCTVVIIALFAIDVTRYHEYALGSHPGASRT